MLCLKNKTGMFIGTYPVRDIPRHPGDISLTIQFLVEHRERAQDLNQSFQIVKNDDACAHIQHDDPNEEVENGSWITCLGFENFYPLVPIDDSQTGQK